MVNIPLLRVEQWPREKELEDKNRGIFRLKHTFGGKRIDTEREHRTALLIFSQKILTPGNKTITFFR